MRCGDASAFAATRTYLLTSTSSSTSLHLFAPWASGASIWRSALPLEGNCVFLFSCRRFLLPPSLLPPPSFHFFDFFSLHCLLFSLYYTQCQSTAIWSSKDIEDLLFSTFWGTRGKFSPPISPSTPPPPPPPPPLLHLSDRFIIVEFAGFRASLCGSE